jgi:hypothetical protein
MAFLRSSSGRVAVYLFHSFDRGFMGCYRNQQLKSSCAKMHSASCWFCVTSHLITSLCIMEHSVIHLLGALCIWIWRVGKKGRLLIPITASVPFLEKIQPNPPCRSYMFCHWEISTEVQSLFWALIILSSWQVYHVSNSSSNCEITLLKLPCSACSTT